MTWAINYRDRLPPEGFFSIFKMHKEEKKN
jgi:hypothetical protein